MTRKRQKSEGLIGFYMRMPADLKKKIDDQAKKKSCSQAQIVVDLVAAGIDRDQPVIEQPKGKGQDFNSWLERQ